MITGRGEQMIQTPWSLKIDEILKLGRIFDNNGELIVSSTKVDVLRHIVRCVNTFDKIDLAKKISRLS